MIGLGIIFLALLYAFLGLQIWRRMDDRRARQMWVELSGKTDAPVSVFDASVFDASMVAMLPEPARRYFTFTVKPGAPLHTVAEVRMRGEIGLGTRDNPKYRTMRAEQILAPPYGLVWKLNAGRGVTKVSGSDGCANGTSWVRFWLMKTVPIVRAGGTPDHARSAFGRVVAEAVFWAPAALLPNNGVSWEAVDANTARATVASNCQQQTVDITVAADGRPTKVVIPRWSDANAEKIYQLQPFGGYLSEFQDFDGYTLPTCVEGGNFIGTEEYFPFYKARVYDFRFR